MIGILTCGLPQASRNGDHPNLRALGAAAGAAPHARAADVVDVVAPAIGEGATVVAVVPTWDLEPTLAALHVARSGLDTTRLVIATTGLPPLAAAVYARTLADLAGRGLLADGVLVSCLEAIERHVVGAAWLGSVARLREPAPRLGLHARSYLPGAAFGAVVDDRPRVHPLSRKEGTTIDLPAARLPGGWRVAVAEGSDADTETVRRSITSRAPGAVTERADLTPVSTGWWGTDELVELALVPADLTALAAAVTGGAVASRCPWCAEPVVADPCPYCGARAGAPAPTPNDAASGGRA